MKEDHEILNDDELKRFFLYESLLLCPSIRQENSKEEKLRILYKTLQRINKLLSLLCRCDWEMHYLEIYQVFGYYFVEKDGEKKKKHRMSARLNAYSQFMCQLTQLKDVLNTFLIYNAYRLDELEQMIYLYFPEDFKKKQEEEVARQGGNTKEKETGNE